MFFCSWLYRIRIRSKKMRMIEEKMTSKKIERKEIFNLK